MGKMVEFSMILVWKSENGAWFPLGKGGCEVKIFECILLICLIVCAVSVAFAKDLLTSIVIFMSYSLIMCVLWVLLKSPDLAITEAAVGAGVTSILFFVTLKKIRAIRKEEQDEQAKGSL